MACVRVDFDICDLDKQGDNKFAIIYQQAASMKKTKQSTANPIPTPTNAAQQT
jgi:hypothetical protein